MPCSFATTNQLYLSQNSPLFLNIFELLFGNFTALKSTNQSYARNIFRSIIICVITGDSAYKHAPGSFIFSLRNQESHPPFKAELKDQSTQYAIGTFPDYGPIFGNNDIIISNKAASNTDSHARISINYKAPSGISDINNVLAGAFHFSPSEVEVFYLLKN